MNRKVLSLVLLVSLMLMFVFSGQVMAETPGTPTLVSPGHGEIVDGTSVELKWDPADGATHYAVWIHNLSDNEDIFFEVVGEGTTYVYDGLSDDGDMYAWSVVGSNIHEGTWGDFAIPIVFIDGSDQDLLPPTLITPEHYENVPGTEIEFTWDAPLGGTHYAVWVYNLTKDEEIIFSAPIEENTFTLDGFADNGDLYAWSVVASNIHDGIWSDFAFPRLFINGTPPDIDYLTVTSTDPPDGAVDVPIDSIITLYFDRNIQLIDTSAIFIPSASLSISYEDNKLIFTPDEYMDYQLDYGSNYFVQIGVDAVAWADDADVKLESPYEFSFTTEKMPPHIHVFPEYNGIWGGDWTWESTITVDVNDGVYTAEFPSDSPNINWEDEQQGSFWVDIDYDVGAGDVITVSSDHDPDVIHEVRYLTIDSVNYDDDVVQGKADEGETVLVEIYTHDPDYQHLAELEVVADDQNEWEATFAPDYNINLEDEITAIIFDENYNQTKVNWHIAVPVIEPDHVYVDIYDGINDVQFSEVFEFIFEWVELFEPDVDEDDFALGGIFADSVHSTLEITAAERHEDFEDAALITVDGTLNISEDDWADHYIGSMDDYMIGTIIAKEPGHSGDGDYELEVRVYPGEDYVPNPHFNVIPQYDHIWGHEWEPNANITININDGAYFNDVDFITNEDGYFNTDDIITHNIEVGDVIEVSDGTIARAHTVIDLLITTVDYSSDTVDGFVDVNDPALQGVSVSVNNKLIDDHHPYRWLDLDQIDPITGTWQADFSLAVPDGEPWEEAYDIEPGDRLSAFARDDQWNATVYDDPMRRIEVSTNHNWISGHEWMPDSTVDIDIADGNSGYSVFDISTDKYGHFHYPLDWEEFNVVAGDVVKVTQGDYSKSYTVTAMVVEEVNIANNTISGTTGVGESWVIVEVDFYEEGAPHDQWPRRAVQSASDGSWEVNFTDPGSPPDWHHGCPSFEIVYQLQNTDRGSASEFDELQNATAYQWGDWSNPHFVVQPRRNDMWGHDWPAGSTVDIEVFDGVNSLGTYTSDVDEHGHFNLFIDDDYDLKSGYEVVVTESDSGLSREHIIEYVRIFSYDTVDNKVYGMSAPGVLLEVVVNLGDDDWDNWPRLWDIGTDEHGNWVADFSGEYDIENDTVIEVFVFDEQHNQTFLYQNRNPEGAHNLTVNPIKDLISGNNWPFDNEISIEVDRAGVKLADYEVMPNEWGDFSYEASVDIQAGDEITLSQDEGSVTTTHIVTELEITEVEGNTVSGTAASGTIVYLYPLDWQIEAAEAETDGTGNWSHIFADNIEEGGWAVQRDGYNSTWLLWPEDVTEPEPNVVTEVEIFFDPVSGVGAVGDEITVSAISEGTGEHEYRFWVQYEGEEWQLVLDYSLQDEYIWEPDQAGGHFWAVWARGVGSEEVYEAEDLQVYEVLPAPPENISVISTEPADGSEDVSVDSNIVVTFDHNIQIIDMSELFIPNASLDIFVEDNKLIFESDEGMDYQLDYDFTYEVQIGVDAVAWADDADVKLESPFEFNFTTEKEPPQIHVFPEHDGIWGGNWTWESTIAVDVNDGDYTAEFTSDHPDIEWQDEQQGSFWVDIDHDVSAGDVITVSSDQDPAVTHEVRYLTIDSVNYDDDIVQGSADEGEIVLVEIYTHDPEYQHLAELQVEADDQNKWEATFAPDYIINLEDEITAIIFDENYNQTKVNWHVAYPHFKVDPDNSNIWGHEWPESTSIYVAIEEEEGGIWEEVWTESTTTNEWGDFDFSNIAFEILPGHLVKVNDTETYKEHLVTALRNVTADPVTNTISGQAEAGSEVDVYIHDGPHEVITVEGDGTWEWVVDPADFEITAGTSGIAWQADQDRDETHIHWHVPDPFFMVEPNSNEVWGHEWPPETSITVEIEREGTPEFSDTIDSNEWGDFELWDIGFDIEVDDLVKVTGGDIEITHVVKYIEVTQIDEGNNLVHGKAEPNSWVEAEVHVDHGEWNPRRFVQANEDGEWTANFDEPGDGECPCYQETCDIGPGSRGAADRWEEDRSAATRIHWHVAQPNFWVDKYHNGIDGDEWLAGAEIEVTIKEHTDELGWVEVWSGETDSDQWGYFGLHNIEHEIVTGNQVIVSDGVTTKDHTVTALRDVSVDPDANTVSGMAEEGTEVYVHIHEHDAPYRVVTVEPDGTWTVSFDEAVGDEPWQQAYDIGPGTHGSADQIDDDGDSTTYSWQIPIPHFFVEPVENSIWGHEWQPNGTIEVTIERDEVVVHSVGTGLNVWGDFDLWGIDFDIQTGDLVTVDDGVTEIEHTVKYLEVEEIDEEHSLVHGLTDPDEWVEVEIHLDNGHDNPLRRVQADKNGHWVANFAEVGEGDYHRYHIIQELQPDSRGSADRWEDDHSASTRIHWRIVGPWIDPDHVHVPVYDGDNDVEFHQQFEFVLEFIEDFEDTVDAGDFELGGVYSNPAHAKDLTVIDAYKCGEWADVAWVTLDGYLNISQEDWEIHTLGDEEYMVGTITALPTGHTGDEPITLEVYIYPHYSNPHFTVNPRWDDMWGHDWPADAELDVTIENPGGPDWSGNIHTNEWGDFHFSLWSEYDIEAGAMITISDGTTTRTHQVEHLRVTDVNYDDNIVYGEAEENREDIDVTIFLGEEYHEHPHRLVNASEDGNWEANFSGEYDITPEDEIHVHARDEEGNGTFAGWSKPDTRISVNPVRNEIGLSDWVPGDDLVITIKDGENIVLTETVQPSTWGYYILDLEGTVDIQAGYEITAEQDGVVKTHIVKNLAVTDVNVYHNYVAGTADENSEVRVMLAGEHFEIEFVTADEHGNWSASFDNITSTSEGYASRHDDTENYTGSFTWLHWPYDILDMTANVVALFPFSSPWGTELAENSAEAALLAVEDVNEWLDTTEHEWRMQLRLEDSEGDASTARGIVESWYDRDVRFFIGPMFSGAAEECLDFANNNEVLLISPSSDASHLAIADDWLFRFTVSGDVEGRAIAAVIDHQEVEHLIFGWSDNWEGNELQSNVEDSLADSINVYHENLIFDPDTADYVDLANMLNTFVADLHDDGSGVPLEKIGFNLIVFEGGTEFLVAAAEYDLLKEIVWIGSSGTALSGDLLENEPAALFAVNSVFINSHSKPYELGVNNKHDHVKDYIVTELGREPDEYAYNTYDAVWALALSIVQEGYSPVEVKSQLPGIVDNWSKDNAASGHIVLNEYGDRAGKFDYWIVEEVAGEFEWVTTNYFYDEVSGTIQTE